MDRLPEKPHGVRTMSFEHSILVTWLPPGDPSRAPLGYHVGYGVGFPDLFRVELSADQLTHVIRNLSEYTIFILAQDILPFTKDEQL